MRNASSFFIDFDLESEVFPIFLGGIILNLLVKFSFAEFNEANLLTLPIWLGGVGTIFVALMLGPWWGASCSLLSTLVIGLNQVSFLKYGVSDVATALVLGYITNSVFFEKHVFGKFRHDGTSSLGHFFSALPYMLLIALGIGVLIGLIKAGIKSYLFVEADIESIRESSIGWYLFGRPDHVMDWLSLFKTYAIGEVLRSQINIAVEVVIAFAIVAWLIPMKQLFDVDKDTKYKWLVSRGSLITFFTISMIYILLIVIWYIDNASSSKHELIMAMQKHPSIVLFLSSNLLSPVLLALLVFLFGVYCGDDGSLRYAVKRLRTRHQHYEKIKNIVETQSQTKWGFAKNIIQDKALITGMLAILAGWNKLFEQSNTLILLLFSMAALYLWRRCKFSSQLLLALKQFEHIKSSNEAENLCTSEFADIVGEVIAYTISDNLKSHHYEVVHIGDEGALLVFAANDSETSIFSASECHCIWVYVLTEKSKPVKNTETMVLRALEDRDIVGVILVVPDSLKERWMKRLEVESEGNRKVAHVVLYSDLRQVLYRKIASVPATDVIQKNWMRAIHHEFHES